MSEDPVSEENLDTVKDYLEEVAERARKERNRDRPRFTHLYSALQQQQVVNKILKKKAEIENRSVLEQEDMFRACRLGHEGLDEYREDAIDKLDVLTEGSITIEKYKDVLAPLGNFILGSKTLKEFCPDYLQPKELGKIGRNYRNVKKKVADIDEETNKYIEDKYTVSMQRDFGVAERKKGDEAIWNIGGSPLRDIENFQIMEAIAKYEKQTGKNAIWRGAKTAPFLKFLKSWREAQK